MKVDLSELLLELEESCPSCGEDSVVERPDGVDCPECAGTSLVITEAGNTMLSFLNRVAERKKHAARLKHNDRGWSYQLPKVSGPYWWQPDKFDQNIPILVDFHIDTSGESYWTQKSWRWDSATKPVGRWSAMILSPDRHSPPPRDE